MPLSTLRETPHDAPRKIEVRMDSLLPSCRALGISVQHAGLSRRTPVARYPPSNRRLVQPAVRLLTPKGEVSKNDLDTHSTAV